MLGVGGGDSGQESGSGSSGKGEDDSNGMDTGDGRDPMVGIEAVDIGKESVVGSPTRVARRVLPALLQESDSIRTERIGMLLSIHPEGI